MKLKIIATVLILTTTLFAFGQDSTQLKRTPYKLKIAVDKKTVYEEDIKATPYVLPNKAIQLYAGETVYIEIDQENGIIKNVTAVDKNVNPGKTLKISFTQTVNKKVHELTMLSIENPFPQDLVYSSKITKSPFPLKATLILIAAAIGIYFGAEYTVQSIQAIARGMSIPESIIALTVLFGNYASGISCKYHSYKTR